MLKANTQTPLPPAPELAPLPVFASPFPDEFPDPPPIPYVRPVGVNVTPAPPAPL